MRYLSLVLAALACGLAATGCGAKNGNGPGGKGNNTPDVFYAYATEKALTDFEDFSGRTESVKSVEVRSQASGYLIEVLFKDGAMVEKDQPLFKIDDRLPKAEFEKAKAAWVQADVRLKRLERDFDRAERLMQQKAISQEEYDKVSGDRAEAEAALGVAKAARDLAKQNLDYTIVTAPIAGRVSYRFKDPGNYVKAGETPLTTVVSYDPMYVYFEIDERTALRLQRLREKGKIRYENGGSVLFHFGLADEEGFRREGKIDFFDNKLDAGTGTLRMRGDFKNPDNLAPGLFVRVRLFVGDPRPQKVVPERALATDQGQKFLFVVQTVDVEVKDKDGNVVKDKAGKVKTEKQDKAIYRPVTVGALIDDPIEERMRVIEGGVLAGDRVVVNGLQRIRDKSVVEPKLEDDRVLPGVWRLVPREIDGKKVAADEIKDATLEIKDRKYITTVKGDRIQTSEATFTINPKVNPKAIDITVEKGGATEVLRGIYAIQGETLTICRGLTPAQERPTEFATRGNPNLSLETWKRQN